MNSSTSMDRLIGRAGVVLVLLFFTLTSSGQGGKLLTGPEQAQVTLDATSNGFRLSFELPFLTWSTVPGKADTYLLLNGSGLTTEDFPGKPAVPVLQKLVDLQQATDWKIDVITSGDTIITLPDNYPLYPHQVSYRKGEDSLTSFLLDTAVYTNDAWYPSSSPVSILSSGTLRGESLGRIIVRPLSYNPVKRVMRCIRKITAEVSFSGSSGTLVPAAALKSPAFSRMFSTTLTGTLKSTKDELTRYPVKYVILADTMFRETLRPFIQWKTSLGYKVVVLYKGDPGVGNTAEEMRTALKNLYLSATAEDPAPTYLLLCGDNEQIPAFVSSYGHLTDLYYAEYDAASAGSGDYFPDVYYGRMSAQTTDELKNQIDKTIEYESYQFPDPSFLDSALMIAGVDNTYAPTYGNGQINYATTYYVNPSSGIYPHTYLHPTSEDKRADILQNLNSGNSLVNYTGHGDVNRWLNPLVTVTDVDSIKNYHRYSLVVSNGCMTNAFGNSICFGEALLQQKDKGAVGHIGGTDDTYWDEDYYWAVGTKSISSTPVYDPANLGAYDHTFHRFGEDPSEWYVSQGQMLFAGNLSVSESGSSRARYYWEAYQLLGDPSLMIYYGRPSVMNVPHPSFLQAGITTMSLTTEPYAYAALTCKDTILSAVSTDDQGIAQFQFNPLVAGDTLSLSVIKQNRQPFRDSIPVISTSGSYVVYKSGSLSEIIPVVLDGQADYNETLGLKTTLENIGILDADSINLNLSSNDTLVTITNPTIPGGTIHAKSSGEPDSIFIIHISGYAQDQHKVPMYLTVTDNKDSNWTSTFYLNLNAPVPGISHIWTDDSLTGNGNFSPDPGESFVLHAILTNSGHSSMFHWPVQASSPQAGVGFIVQNTLTDSLSPGDSVLLTWNCALSDTFTRGDSVIMRVSSGYLGHILNQDCIRQAGNVEDDFETGNLTRHPYSWSGNACWSVTSSNPFHGKFSARSGEIGDSRSSILSLRVCVLDSGRVSFYYRVSSEVGYDYFDFSIDDVKKVHCSGLIPWVKTSFPVSTGWHVFTWKYSKDSNTKKGLDAAFIDDLSFPPSYADSSVNVTIFKIMEPVEDSTYSTEAYPAIRIINRSEITVRDITTGYFLENDSAVYENIDDSLKPGNSMDFKFSSPVIPGHSGTYRLTSFISHPGDSYTADDTLAVQFTCFDNSSPLAPSLSGLKIWPVPCDQTLYLTWSASVISVYVTITDLSGRQIMGKKTERAECAEHSHVTLPEWTIHPQHR